MKLILASGAVLMVSACKEVQVYGPVVGADVVIDSLQYPGSAYQSTITTTQSDAILEHGKSKWDSFNNLAKLIFIGNFDVDKGLLADEDFYLVTAKNGKDADGNFDQIVDASPKLVQGEVHAIMSGASLKGYFSKVSVLTEAAYQYVISQPDYPVKLKAPRSEFNTFLIKWLNDFARKTTPDISGDGVIDYSDVLLVSGYLNLDRYEKNTVYLDQLASGISLGLGKEDLARLARQIVENRSISPLPPVQEQPSIGPTICMTRGSTSGGIYYAENGAALTSVTPGGKNPADGDWIYMFNRPGTNYWYVTPAETYLRAYPYQLVQAPGSCAQPEQFVVENIILPSSIAQRAKYVIAGVTYTLYPSCSKGEINVGDKVVFARSCSTHYVNGSYERRVDILKPTNLATCTFYC
jgi:hypothetical protein